MPKATRLHILYMNDKIIEFGNKIYDWLSTFAPTYRGVLPSGEKPNDLYLKFDGYYDLLSQFILPVSIYSQNTTSFAKVLILADNIARAITKGGLLLSYDNIKIKIEKGSPFYQDKPDENETVKAGYINLLITIY